MAQRVANYEIDRKLDILLEKQNELAISVARIEENIGAHAATLERHERAIRENSDDEKRWRGFNAIIAAFTAAIAAIIGASN